MRLYSLTNMYLSPIQKGIQTAHALHELYEKYHFSSHPASLKINQWAKDHKTIIVLDGGFQSAIAESVELFYDIYHTLHLPYAFFKEEENALNGALTAACIIVPESIYNMPETVTPTTIHAQWSANAYDNYIDPAENNKIYHKELASLRLYNHLKSKRLA